jgi:transposase
VLGQTLGRHGYSNDHRPDLLQMILAVLIDGYGRPVFCIAADRGMISAETIAELEARKLLCILGVRSDKLVRDLVIDDPTPFILLTISKHDKSVDYEAKVVALAGRRYILCRNHEQVQKNVEDRASILAALSRQLKKGDKALIGNSGYRLFLRATGEDCFAIDEAKAEEDAKFDGIFVLRNQYRHHAHKYPQQAY